MATKLKFSLPFDRSLEGHLAKHHPEVMNFRILSQSLDARHAPKGKKPTYSYILEVLKADEKFSKEQRLFQSVGALKKKPVIIGAGPAGLFAALRLMDHGIPSVVLERGDSSNRRMIKISKYWRYGELDKESNVCFGEGGAGLFSDGKLITRVKSHEISYVMQRLVDFGAPEETAYLSNPHLGSNKIRVIIAKISEYLSVGGSEVRCNQRVDEIIFDQNKKVTGVKLQNGEVIETDHVILATGHSGKEMYEHLISQKVEMALKDFAVGVRIEHPREYIDEIQHGPFFKELEAARYRLSYHDHSIDRGGYSFCMCPGGYVLASSTDQDGMVTNGMSNYARNSPWSNAALVVSVKSGKDFSGDILSGLQFIETIERKAFALSKKMASGKELPALTVGEFLSGKIDWKTPLPKTSTPSGLFKADIREVFPQFVNDQLQRSLIEFEKKLKGFTTHQNAVLIAPETRTSAPLRIVRNEHSYQSPTHQGLFPCGEGAGYAGGITSAAVDGIVVATALVNEILGTSR